MFTVICCEQPSEGLKRLFSRQEYYVNTINEGKLRFLILTVKGGKKINWDRLSRMLGNRKQDILFQEGLIPPPEVSLLPPDTQPYARRMTRNAAEKILRRAKELRENRVLLLDEKLEFSEEAEMVLNYCDRLTVLTEQADGYSQLPQERISYLPFEQSTALLEQTLVLAPRLPERLIEAGLQFGKAPVLTGFTENLDRYSGTVMTGFTAPLSGRYLPFLPERVNETRFAAALYSCCGVTDVGEALPDRCDVYQGGNLAAKQVAF